MDRGRGDDALMHTETFSKRESEVYVANKKEHFLSSLEVFSTEG